MELLIFCCVSVLFVYVLFPLVLLALRFKQHRGGNSGKSNDAKSDGLVEYSEDVSTDNPLSDGKDVIVNSSNSNSKLVNKKSSNVNSNITLHPVLTEDEKILLKSSYPELKLKFCNTTNEPHAFSHCSRICERRIMLLNMHIDGSSAIREDLRIKGYDFELVDVGGRVTQNAYDMLSTVHVENPVLSVRDKARILSDSRSLENRYNNYRNGKFPAAFKSFARVSLLILENFLNDFKTFCNNTSANTKYWCFKCSESCNYTAINLMFLHSMYDMSNSTVANIFKKKNARFGYATLLYDFNIFTDATSGYISEQKCRWRKENSNIVFYFENDHSQIYTHSLSDYVSKFENTKFVSSDRSCIVESELIGVRCGIQYFKFVRVDGLMSSIVDNEFSKHILQSKDNKNLVRVKFYKPVLKSLGKDCKRFIEDSIVVPKSYYSRVFSEVLRADNGRFTLNSIVNILTTMNNQVCINGAEIVRKTELDAVTNYRLAHALFLYAFVIKFDNYCIVDAICDSIKHCRQVNSSIFTIFIYKLLYFICNYVPFVSSFVQGYITVYDSVSYSSLCAFRDSVLSFNVNYDIVVEDVVCELPSKEFLFTPSKVSALKKNKKNVSKGKNFYNFSKSRMFVDLVHDSEYGCEYEFESSEAVPGDGNCGMYSLNYFLNYSDDLSKVRKDIVRFAKSKGIDLSSCVNDGEWVTFTFLKYACEMSGYNLCMHEDSDVGKHRVFCDNSVDETIHIHFSNGHFNPVTDVSVEKVTVDAVVKNKDVVVSNVDSEHVRVNYVFGDNAGGFEIFSTLCVFVFVKMLKCDNRNALLISLFCNILVNILLPVGWYIYSQMSIVSVFLSYYISIFSTVIYTIWFIAISVDVFVFCYYLFRITLRYSIKYVYSFIVLLLYLVFRYNYNYAFYLVLVFHILYSYKVINFKIILRYVLIILILFLFMYFFNSLSFYSLYSTDVVNVNNDVEYIEYRTFGEIYDAIVSYFYVEKIVNIRGMFILNTYDYVEKYFIFSYQGLSVFCLDFVDRIKDLSVCDVITCSNVVKEDVLVETVSITAYSFSSMLFYYLRFLIFLVLTIVMYFYSYFLNLDSSVVINRNVITGGHNDHDDFPDFSDSFHLLYTINFSKDLSLVSKNKSIRYVNPASKNIFVTKKIMPKPAVSLRDKTVKPILTINEIEGDIFTSSDSVFMQCISADAQMSKGIAVDFNVKFPNMKLAAKESDLRVGNVFVYRCKGFIVLNLVTKKCFSDKPTYDNMCKCLNVTKNFLISNRVASVTMCKLGCGLDLLQWVDTEHIVSVRGLIKGVFHGMDLTVNVYSKDGFSFDYKNYLKREKYFLHLKRDVEDVSDDLYDFSEVEDDEEEVVLSDCPGVVETVVNNVYSSKIWSYRLMHSLEASVRKLELAEEDYSYLTITDNHHFYYGDVNVYFCTKCEKVSECLYYKVLKYVDYKNSKYINYTANLLNSSEYKIFHAYVDNCANVYDYLLNALKERILIGKKEVAKIHSDNALIASSCCKNNDAAIKGFHDELWKNFIRANPEFSKIDFAVYDIVLQCFVTKCKLYNENFVNSKGIMFKCKWRIDAQFVNPNDVRDKSSLTFFAYCEDRYVFTTSALSIFVEPDILSNLSKVMMNSSIDVLPKINMINGLPGCGKTTRVIRDFVCDGSTLIVCSTKDARADVCKRLSEKYAKEKVDKDKYQKILSLFVRTIDSVLVNESVKTNKVKVDSVFVDEALMRHPGEIFALMKITECTSISLIGDIAQIPYVCRVSDYVPLFKCFPFVVTERMYVSYRCPVDVIASISSCYDEQTYSASRVERSMSVEFLSNENQLAKYSSYADTKVIVFKQSEKQVLNAMFRKNIVSTVHEFQGQQCKNVVLVRLSDKASEEIYLRSSYALVAVSRHTNSFVYKTMCASKDAVIAFVDRYKSQNISKFYKSVGALKGGYVSASFPVSKDTSQIKIFSDEVVQDICNSSASVFRSMNVDARIQVSVEAGRGYQGIDVVFVDLDRTYFNLSRYQCFSASVLNLDFSKTVYTVNDLQFEYDRMLPQNASRNQFLDTLLVEKSDLTLHLDNIRCRTALTSVEFKNEDSHLYPLLKTSCPIRRVETFKEILLAIQKRNANVPEMQGVVIKSDLAKLLYKNFINVYFDKSKLYLLSTYDEYKLYPTHRSVSNWWNASSFTNSMYMFNEYVIDIFNMDFNRFDYTIKPTPKPVQTLAASTNYQALQTIAAHKKYINSVFCPIIKDFKARLLLMLKPKYMIFTDESVEDFTDRLNFFCSPANMTDMISKNLLYARELDISKYDKSQGYEALTMVCAVMKLLGVPVDVVNYYFNSNVLCYMSNQKHKIHFFVNYQMKSGTAPTLIGNTIFTMAINALYYNDVDVLFALFCGDDALYVLKRSDSNDLEDKATHCSMLLNLEIKEFSYNYFYFCSKFFLLGTNTWYIIPDPLKLLNKLGRSDILDQDHAEEYRISASDNFRVISEEALFLLDSAVSERYKVNTSNVSVIIKLLYFLSNKEYFSKLYCEPSNYVKPHTGFVRYDLGKM